MKICILIPAYNEENTIGKIIEDLRFIGYQVFVIDDGSSDETGLMAAKAGAVLITNNVNMGKGASIKEGFRFITDNTNYDAVIIMDGDGQHRVEDIHKFAEVAEAGYADLIVGNRMGSTYNMPYIRKKTNEFMSSFLSALCKQRIPDTQCGFRLIKRHVMENLKLVSSNYDTESEMLIEASRKGYKIVSVPVQTVYGQERSDIHPIKDTLRFAALIIKYYFKGD